jgi:hypothetical protein
MESVIRVFQPTGLLSRYDITSEYVKPEAKSSIWSNMTYGNLEMSFEGSDVTTAPIAIDLGTCDPEGTSITSLIMAAS